MPGDAVTTHTCPDCGVRIADGASMCIYCGAKVESRSWSVGATVLVIVWVVLTVAITITGYFFSDDDVKIIWLVIGVSLAIPAAIFVAVVTIIGAVALFSIASDSDHIGIALYVILWVIASPLMIVASFAVGLIGVLPKVKTSN